VHCAHHQNGCITGRQSVLTKTFGGQKQGTIRRGDVAVNLLGIIAGAGQPDNFLDQLWTCWEKAEDFRLPHGDYPSPDEFVGLLPDLSERLTDAERARVERILTVATTKALDHLEQGGPVR
jgi:hypothetical protein